MTFLKLYTITLCAFLAIDALWLGIIAKGFYRQQIGFLMKDQMNWVAALLFYIVFAVGIVVFALMPAIESGSWVRATLLGALLGFLAYAAYDLTNLATIKNWPIVVTIVDLAWGTFLTALVSTVAYFIARI